jgi:hypothetical protein
VERRARKAKRKRFVHVAPVWTGILTISPSDRRRKLNNAAPRYVARPSSGRTGARQVEHGSTSRASGGEQDIEAGAAERRMARRSQGIQGAGGRNREPTMSIAGCITTRDVLKHSATILREYGVAVYARCCLAIVLGRRTTFLECVFSAE